MNPKETELQLFVIKLQFRLRVYKIQGISGGRYSNILKNNSNRKKIKFNNISLHNFELSQHL